MKQKVINFWLLLIVPLLMCFSCTESEFQSINEDTTPAFELNNANVALEDLALLIQEANSSNQFREELRNEAIKEYADDYYAQKAELKSEGIENQIKKIPEKFFL